VAYATGENKEMPDGMIVREAVPEVKDYADCVMITLYTGATNEVR